MECIRSRKKPVAPAEAASSTKHAHKHHGKKPAEAKPGDAPAKTDTKTQ